MSTSPLLLSLPNELIQAIAAFTIPEGIESFALSCRKLHSAAEGFLPEHNRLRKRFRRFAYPIRMVRLRGNRNTEAEKSEVAASAIALLQSIADNPLIARYIEVADLRNGDQRIVDGDDDGVLQALRNDEAERDKVLRLLQDSKYLADAHIEPSDFLDVIVKDPTNVILKAFLFTLLPNVRDMTPPSCWDCVYGPSEGYEAEEHLWRLLDAIVRRANSSDGVDGAALARLETLRPLAKPEYDLRICLQSFTSFLSLPNVKNFYSASLLAFVDGYTGTRMLEPRYETFGQALETVWMEGCCVDPGNIRKMLACCPRIRDFRFSFETKWHGCGHYTDMGHFVEAVEDTTYDRLENLTIAVSSCFGGTGTGTVSMKRFDKLKKLEISVECFEGPPCGGEVDRNWNTDEAGESARGENETPPFTDIIPHTVEELSILALRRWDQCEILARLFRGVTRTSLSKLLPNLRSITVALGVGSEAGDDIEDSMNGSHSDEAVTRWDATKDAILALGGRIDTPSPRERPSWTIPRTGGSRSGVSCFNDDATDTDGSSSEG